MEGIQQYIFSVCISGILCSIIVTLFQNNSPFSKLLKTITGIFMIVVLISPITHIDIPEEMDIFSGIASDAKSIRDNVSASNEKIMRTLIKEKTEAYILDKASQQGIEVTLNIDLSDGSNPIPEKIMLYGNASPSARQTLTYQLATDLNISKESILWNCHP